MQQNQLQTDKFCFYFRSSAYARTIRRYNRSDILDSSAIYQQQAKIMTKPRSYI